MQVQITGQYVNAQQKFDNGSFKKQTIVVETMNQNNYKSYFPIEFHQADVDNLFAHIQPHGFYTFTCWVQGSNQIMSDKNQQPTAYVSLKCTKVDVAAAQLPHTSPITAPQPFGQQPQQQAFPAQPQQGFIGQPQQPQAFAQPQQPAPTQQTFGSPQQQGFGTPAQPVQPQGSPFGQPAQPFGQQPQ